MPWELIELLPHVSLLFPSWQEQLLVDLLKIEGDRAWTTCRVGRTATKVYTLLRHLHALVIIEWKWGIKPHSCEKYAGEGH